MTAAATVAGRLAAYLADAGSASAEVVDAARRCLVDWLGVSLAAIAEPEARILAGVLGRWHAGGDAPLLWGGSTSPPLAALGNGSLSHVLDFDDTHIPSVMHGSGPLWAALLASARARGFAETRLPAAFAAGFQLGATLGGDGLGVRLTGQGWHATPVLGRVGAAAALAVAGAMPPARTVHALALAATAAGGLNASFGSMAKPLHIGRTAMDAVIAADLAEAGFEGAPAVFEAPGGLLPTLLQDPSAAPSLDTLDGPAAILDNSFKPYAACQLTHAAIDAARALAGRVAIEAVARLQVFVHPLAAAVAARQAPQTPAEARFSLAWCVALGLQGHTAGAADFTPARLADAGLQALAARVEVLADEGEQRTSARLTLTTTDGSPLHSEVAAALGSPGRPMGWPALERKFLDLVEPVLGVRAGAVLAVARGIGEPGSLEALFGQLAEAFPAGRGHA